MKDVSDDSRVGSECADPALIAEVVEGYFAALEKAGLDAHQSITVLLYTLIWWIDVEKEILGDFKDDLVEYMVHFMDTYAKYDSVEMQKFSEEMQEYAVTLSKRGKERGLSPLELIYSCIYGVLLLSEKSTGASKDALDANIGWLEDIGKGVWKHVSQ